VAALRPNLAIIGAVILGGCTAQASGSASEVTVNEQDFGHSISIHVGDTVKVDLLDKFYVPGSSVIWSADTSNANVLQRISTSRQTPPVIMNAQAHYVAVFKAIARGTATIQATGAASCEAMNPAFCPQQSGTISVAID
jgi:hypothetical protein